MKKILQYSFSAFCFVILFACQSDNSTNSEPIFSLKNIPTTLFQIQASKDTVLEGQKGIRLFIPPNVFMDKNGVLYKGTVNIELLECLTLEDAIKADLETITKEGQLLKSSGMFRISIKGKNGQELTIIPDSKIRVTVPNKGDNNSQIFYGQNEDGRMTWTASHLVNGDSTNYWLVEGRKLLFEHCASCHNVDLVSDMTGPALAWVSKRWEKMSELVLFTKNSEALASLGHPRAKYMIGWSGSCMTNFYHLSDQEIKAIYNYIDEECLRRKIDSVVYGQSYDNGYYTKYTNEWDSIYRENFPYSFGLDGYTISSTEWINVDRYPQMGNFRQINLSVKIEGEPVPGKTKLKLIFSSQSFSIVNAFYDSSKGYYTFMKGTNKINLPVGEDVFLQAISNSEESPYYALKKIVIGKNESETMVLKQSTYEEIMNGINKSF